ncbi:MAG: hypothetical protein AAFQ87_17720, partial [Bacteroidota bacterium]
SKPESNTFQKWGLMLARFAERLDRIVGLLKCCIVAASTLAVLPLAGSIIPYPTTQQSNNSTISYAFCEAVDLRQIKT